MYTSFRNASNEFVVFIKKVMPSFAINLQRHRSILGHICVHIRMKPFLQFRQIFLRDRGCHSYHLHLFGTHGVVVVNTLNSGTIIILVVVIVNSALLIDS